VSKPILIVEDDDAAYLLLEIVFEDFGDRFTVSRVVDGYQALMFLRHQDPFYTVPRPDLIFLDLNLPKMDGFEVLQALQQDESLTTIPIVVFTSSTRHADRARCLALGATHFLSKPHDLSRLMDAVKTACAYAV
jgi:two-component system, chemotaxis family, response regulator Rcp1